MIMRRKTQMTDNPSNSVADLLKSVTQSSQPTTQAETLRTIDLLAKAINRAGFGIKVTDTDNKTTQAAVDLTDNNIDLTAIVNQIKTDINGKVTDTLKPDILAEVKKQFPAMFNAAKAAGTINTDDQVTDSKDLEKLQKLAGEN